MLFAYDHFADAVTLELGAFFGAKVPFIYRAVAGVEATTDTRLSSQDVGKILALLLVPDTVPACGALGPALNQVVLYAGEREVEFSPEAAKGHPLFGRWIGSTLAESLALAFAASGDLSLLAAGAPLAMTWEVGAIGDVLSAEVELEFACPALQVAPVAVAASYGAAEAPPGLLSARKLTGLQLARMAARTFDATREADAASAAAEAAALTLPADTLH